MFEEENKANDTITTAGFTLQDPLHGREILSTLALDKGKVILTGSEDTTFKVLAVDASSCDVKVISTFSQHEASVRSFAKCKMPPTSDGASSHVIVSAGSTMQAHVFLWHSSQGQRILNHVCNYSQQLFKQPKRTGKEFGAQVNTQDFRIMSAAVTRLNNCILVLFGTSSGQIVMNRLSNTATEKRLH